MEKQKDTKHSRMTQETSLGLNKDNIGEVQTTKHDETHKPRHEYNFMDGVLGCVKV